jgi:hypothetical protein
MKKSITKRLLIFFLAVIVAIPLITLFRLVTKTGYTPVAKEIWRGSIFPGFHYVKGDKNKSLCAPIPIPYSDEYGTNKNMLGKLYFFSANASRNVKHGKKQLAQIDALVKIGFFQRFPGEKTIKNEIYTGFYYQLTEQGWAETSYKRENCLNYGEKEFLGASSMKNLPHDSGHYQLAIREGISAPEKLRPWALDPDIQQAFPEIQQSLAGVETVLTVSRENFLIASMLSLTGIRGLLDWTMPVQPDENKRATKENIVYETEKDHLYEHISYLDLPNVADVDSIISHQEYSVIVFPDPPEKLTHPAIKRKAYPYLERLVDIGVLQRTFEPGLPLYRKQSNPERGSGYVYRLTPFYQKIWQSSANTERPPGTGRLPLGPPTSRLISFDTDPDNALPWLSLVRYRKRITFEDPPRWAKDEALLEKWPELEKALHGYACTGILHYNRITKKFSTEGTYQSCEEIYNGWDK